MRTLVDEATWSARRCLRYLAIGMAGWIVYMAIQAGLSQILRPSLAALRGLQAMLPHSPGERVWWIVFAVTVGVCEEFVYRGYLLRQFRAMSGSALFAVVLQALCYGLVHIVLPPQMLVGIVVLGLLLGALTIWQKSLLPGMVLHVAVGLVAIVQPG